MKRRVVTFALCLLMMFALLSMMSSPATATWQHVPAGWTAQTEGYFGTIEDGRDTLAAIRTYRQEAAAWERTVQEIRAEVAASQLALSEQIRQLQEDLSRERDAWQSQISRERRKWAVYTLGALALGYVVGD